MAGKIIKMPTYYMIVTSFKSYLFIFFSQAHYKGGKVAKLWRYAQRIEMISKRALDMQIWSPLLTWHYHLIGNVLSSQECLYRYVMTSQVMTLSLIKKVQFYPLTTDGLEPVHMQSKVHFCVSKHRNWRPSELPFRIYINPLWLYVGLAPWKIK